MNKFKQKFTYYLHSRNFPSHILVCGVIALVVVVNMIIYALSGVLPLYIYSPTEDDLSVSDACDALFEGYIGSGEVVTVTFCSYEDAVESHSTGKFVLETARGFAEKYPGFINLRFVNALTLLDSNGASVADELAIYSDGGNNLINDTSVIFSSETGFRVLTDMISSTGYADFFTFDDSLYITSYNGEEVFASSVIRALGGESETVYMTVGHGESANGTLYNILTSAGYNVRELDLRKKDVPDDAAFVVISNPISDIERGATGSSLITEYDRLISYRDKGGQFLLFFDPAAKRLPVLWDFVDDFGISLGEHNGLTPLVKDGQNAITTDGFTLVSETADSISGRAISDLILGRTDGNGRVIVRAVAPLVLNPDSSAEAVLLASEKSTLESDGQSVGADGGYVIAASAVMENDLTDSARIFVMSDGMLTASDAIVTDGYSNKDFLFALFDSFFGGEDMPYGCRSVIYNEQILENLTMGEARIYTAILFAIPILLAAFGGVILVRRRNA